MDRVKSGGDILPIKRGRGPTLAGYNNRSLSLEVFTTGQMAAVMNVSPRTITKLLDEKSIIPFWRVPGQSDRRCWRKDFINYIRQNMPTLWEGLSGSVFFQTIVAANSKCGLIKRVEELDGDDGHVLSAVVVESPFELGRFCADSRPDCLIIDPAVWGREMTKMAINFVTKENKNALTIVLEGDDVRVDPAELEHLKYSRITRQSDAESVADAIKTLEDHIETFFNPPCHSSKLKDIKNAIRQS